MFNERNLPIDTTTAAAAASADTAGGTQQEGADYPQFLAIPTCQQAREDLVAVGDHIEQEKDRLLNAYMNFARSFCERVLGQQGRGNAGEKAPYWADYIDPCSGLPMLTLNCNKVYSEVDGMECCLGYKSYNAGFCKILTHPKWGSAVYPATIFVYAPKGVVLQIMQSYPNYCAANNKTTVTAMEQD